jgi:glycosyltransferase involved in cell wall biosynthesis
MKVAMIGLRGIPGKSGGIETSVEQLAPRLVKLGCDVTVFCREHYCPEKPAHFKGVNLKYFSSFNTKYTETLLHSTLSTANAAFNDYDIVHFHAMANGAFSLIPRITGKKTVVTLHGLDWEREKWGKIAKAFLKVCERMICVFPNQVIAVSKKIKDYYKDKYRKSIHFIPNGVEEAKFRKLKHLKKYGLSNDNYILFLSRIVPEKEVHTLIMAFKRVKTNVKLVIAGDTAHTDDYLKKAMELAKDDERIIFTGPLYSESKEEAFSNCRFFVLPSTIEGMPIVLLEAMSYSKCPLVSNIKENLDVVEGNAFSFTVRDHWDLARKITFMLKNKEIVRKNGKLCRELVRKEYRWDSIAKQTLNVYKEALNGKKR